MDSSDASPVPDQTSVNTPIPRVMSRTLLRSLVLVAAVFCAPSVGLETGFLQSASAIAGCGDWLARHDAYLVVNTTTQLIPQNGSSAVTRTFLPMPVADEDGSLPRCRGPLCDRAPAPFPAPEQRGFSRMIPSDWGDWHPGDSAIETGADIARFSTPQTMAGRNDPERLERPPRAV